MAIAANAIADDSISCAAQDVRSALSPEETPYGECLAQLTGSDGRGYAASAFVSCFDASSFVTLVVVEGVEAAARIAVARASGAHTFRAILSLCRPHASERPEPSSRKVNDESKPHQRSDEESDRPFLLHRMPVRARAVGVWPDETGHGGRLGSSARGNRHCCIGGSDRVQ